MKKICNSCGREFEEPAIMHSHTAENGTEYILCDECETDGIEIVETTTYCVCKNCGFIYDKDGFDGECKFCGENQGYGEIEITQAEEYELDTNPLKVYEEKLGKPFAEKIAEWKESEKRKETDRRHKRDMHIDTTFVVGIILAYFMVDWNIRSYVQDKLLFVLLLIPTLLTLFAAPLFKMIDKRAKRHLPIWIILAIMAVLVDIYGVIIMLMK